MRASPTAKIVCPARRPFIVPAVNRAVDILYVLKKERGEHGISELARTTGTNKATVRQIIATLERPGWRSATRRPQHNEKTKKPHLQMVDSAQEISVRLGTSVDWE